MSAFAQVLKHLIEADRILDDRIERIEAQLATLNAKLVVMQRSLDGIRAKLAHKDDWDDVQILTEEDLVGAGAAPKGQGIVGTGEVRSVKMTTVSGKDLRIEVNSNAVAALPTTEELFAGLDNIIR